MSVLREGMNMADVEDIDTENLLALLNKYSTELLDPRWIEAMVDTDYTECDAMPPQFEEHHMQTNWVSLLKETGRVCRGFVLQVECRPDASADGSTVDRSMTSSVFWTALAEHGIRHQSLVALLFYFMFSGQKCDATMDDREEGLLSATVYFLLLAIPGSNAFRVFHPVLYSRALDSFKLVGQLTSRRGSTRKPSRAADDELPVDEDEDEPALEPHEAARLLRLLNTVLGDLLLLTERFSLRHGADSLEETVQTLVDVTRLECVDGRAGRAVTGVPALAHNSFCGLTNVSRPLHGSVTRGVGLVLRALMPSLLMAGEAAPRALAAVRDRAVRFVGQLVRAAGAVAESPLQTLVQNVCLRVPERAEQRQRAAQSVVLLLALMSAAQRRRALDWLRRFARHEKSGHRLLALELLSRLLAERPRGAGRPAGSWLARDDSDLDRSDTEDDEEEKVAAERHGGDGGPRTAAEDEDGALSRAFLVRQIFARCRDPAATVRARALTVLAECTVSRDAAIRAAVRQLFHGARRRRAASPAQPQESDSDGDGSDDSDGDMMAMLRRRAKDDKVMVRKSALQVIENVMRLDPDCVTPQNLQVFLEHCRDPALLARKQCQSSLIGLVEEYPGDDSVCEAVVRGLLPQIHDPENKVQDRVVQFVEQTILSGIAPYREGELASAEQQLPWKLLDLVVKLCFQKYLHKIMQAVFTGKKIKPGVCQTLRSHVGTAHNSPAWMCLALISRFSPIEQPLFALEYFTEKIQTDLMTEDVLALQQALYVLQFSVVRLSASAASRLLAALAGLVTAAALPPELIPAAVDTMAMVSFEAGPEDGYRARLDEWCSPLIEDCEDLLTKQLLRPAAGVAPDWEDRLVRQIHTFGDLAQLVPARVNKRCFLMLQNLIYVEQQGKGGSAGGWKSAGGLQNPSSRLRAVAIATLGKLCLQHEQMAKRVVPALGKILDVTDEPAIKNNVIFTLSDMCVRYATLVDPLMPQVTCCLKDRSLVVRRNCLILLIRLLQEDYLKLKGTFFFRLIQCLVDPEAEIRQLITFYLTERLLKRSPKVFFQHFVECLFLYNEYEDHESYNKLPQTERERKVFALRGPEHRNKRLHIYKVMLEHMPDDQRFQTSHKLCQDILGGLVDGKITLNEVSTQMLHDTLAILSCDEIKLQSLKTRPEDQEPPTDASGMAEVFQAVAKKTLISQVVKKNVIENMVPIIIALKHKLETSRSPLLKELMVFLKDLMKDYKNEIQDILVADKQLAKEIEFDMKRLSEENNRSRAEPPAGPAGDAGAAAAATATPRNKHIHSVLVEAIKSAHRLSAGRAARRPFSEAADDDADADGGAAADQERAPTASNAASPELSSPAGVSDDLLRAISTPQPGGAVQNLTFLDRDVSAILRLSPVVRMSRPPRGGAETPSGGDGAEQQGRRDRRSARRGLGSQLAGSAIQEQEEEEERLGDT